MKAIDIISKHCELKTSDKCIYKNPYVKYYSAEEIKTAIEKVKNNKDDFGIWEDSGIYYAKLFQDYLLEELGL